MNPHPRFIYERAILSSSLAPGPRLLALVLAHHADRDLKCYPGRQRLRAMTGAKSLGTISGWMGELERAGWVVVKRQRRSSSWYHLIIQDVQNQDILNQDISTPDVLDQDVLISTALMSEIRTQNRPAEQTSADLYPAPPERAPNPQLSSRARAEVGGGWWAAWNQAVAGSGVQGGLERWSADQLPARLQEDLSAASGKLRALVLRKVETCHTNPVALAAKILDEGPSKNYGAGRNSSSTVGAPAGGDLLSDALRGGNK